jgi:hypothetical protein
MDRATLLQALDHPRAVALGAETWDAASVLAGLRQAVNDPIRAGDRDRGTTKNWLADIWGVIGELVALRVVNEITNDAVAHHPIDFERSVDEADLVVAATDGPLRLEAKAHLLERGKAWFMVNERARDRSARRGACGYVPVLTALGASRAVIGRMITIDEMGAWQRPGVALRDPAVGVRLEELATRSLGAELAAIAATMKPEAVVPAHRLRALAEHAGADVQGWRRRLPPLGGLPAREVVDAVNDAIVDAGPPPA